MSRLLVATVLVSALVFGVAGAAPAAVAGAKDPKSAKAVAALLAAKQVGCTDFASETAPGTTSSTLPAGLDILASKLKGASIGSCTVDGQQTLLVAFKNARARKRFETAVQTLPCLVIKVLEDQLITPAAGTPTGTLAIPLVDVGSKALVLGTGTAPGADQLDLTTAAATDAKVAAAAKGTVRTFSFTCP